MTSTHTSTLRRLAASAVVGTAATVALAAPAQAMFVHDPGITSPDGSTPTSTTTQTSDNGLLQIGVGAAGGIVLAGAAAGAAAGLHRRRMRVAHPA